MPHIQTSGKHLDYSSFLLNVLVPYRGKPQEMTVGVCGKGGVCNVVGNILKVAPGRNALVKLN